MADLQRALIRYFRDCLVADAGERQLRDIFSSSDKNHLFTALAADSVTGIPVRWPLATAHATALAAALQLQRQERVLLLGTSIVCARMPDDEEAKGQLVRAPLFVTEVRLAEEDGTWQAHADLQSTRVNPAALAALGFPDDFAPEPSDSDPAFAVLKERLDMLAHEPPPASASEVRAPRHPTAHVVDANVLWLAERSRIGATSAFELTQLADAPKLSEPLLQVLGQRSRPAPGRASTPDALPLSLTASQRQALVQAATSTLSVLNGPPGTGKTFSIASMVVDRVLQGERVLVVCGNQHAADVVHARLAEGFGDAMGMVVHAGQGEHRQQLLRRIDALLAGTMEDAATPGAAPSWRDSALQLRAQERRFERAVRRATRLGRASAGLRSAFGAGGWRARWLQWLSLRKPLLARTWHALKTQSAQQQAAARAHLNRSADARQRRLVQAHRKELAALAVALRSRSSGSRADRFTAIDWQTLTSAFPVWVMPAQALDRVLPMDCELFDLVIVDEATQCNLAQALPALQRARRAMIVGDPQQLRHFSFLARARQDLLAYQHGVTAAAVSLDYRERSLLDFALDACSADARVLLDEHFRSHPALIDFSNRTFYGNRLKVMTATRQILAASASQQIECPVRVVGGVNEAEVDAVVARLGELFAAASALPEDGCASIGVLALFAELARAIERRVLKAFDLATLARHDVRVATPYGFQGEERDVMLIATGVFPGRARAAWSYIGRPDVFNVAVTRARHRQIVFIGEGVKGSSEAAGSLLAAFLAQDAEPTVPAPESDARTSAMRLELMSALEAEGARCWPDFALGGESVDLLAVRDRAIVAIDLVGCDSRIGAAWTRDRYRLLERAGLEVVPVAFVDWRWRQADVMADLRSLLGTEAQSSRHRVARQLSALRWRFERLQRADDVARLDAIDAAWRQTTRWLDRRFKPHELTHARYLASIDRLGAAAVAELKGMCILLEEAQALGLAPDELARQLAPRSDACDGAANALHALARQFALADADADSGIDASIDDIVRLTQQVAAYAGAPAAQRDPGDASRPLR